MQKNLFLFKISKFYKKNIIFFSNNLFNLLKKNNLYPKKLNVLDYGCGNCLLHKYLKFRKVYLFDPNFYYYRVNLGKNFIILKNEKKIFNSKKKYDLIILNSVIQYINSIKLKKLILTLENKVKPNGLILISDIPRKSRLLEIFDINNILIILRLFFYFRFNKNYLEKKFFYYKKNFFLNLNRFSNKEYSFQKNLNLMNSRYSLIIHDKKKNIN